MFAISNILILLIGSTTAVEKALSLPDFTTKTQVALVSLDAVIKNSKGEFIDHLQQSDFKIYDEGIAQEIALFSHNYKPLDIALVIDASGSEQKFRSRLRDAALDVL